MGVNGPQNRQGGKPGNSGQQPAKKSSNLVPILVWGAVIVAAILFFTVR